MKRLSVLNRTLLAVLLILMAVALAACGPKVPDVKGKPAAEAVRILQDAGYKLGDVQYVYTPGLPPDTVAAQSPSAGDSAREGTAVDLRVARALGALDVPNLVGMTNDAAISAVASAQMTATPVGQYNDTVPTGQVFAQVPAAGSKADVGAMVVFAYSRGKAPAKVTVPKVVGMKKADADAALEKAGLNPERYEGYSDTVAAGVVAGQDPAAGASVKPGAKVAYMASLGKAPSGTAASITVPNVKGKSQSDAEAAIKAAGLVPNVVKDENSAPKGTVAGQMPPSGSKAVKGGVVGILVSLGETPEGAPPAVTVPNVKGKSKADAEAAIEDLGLVPYSTEQPSADVPAGQVIDQLPAGGESVPAGWPVIFAVSSGTPPAAPMSVPATQP